MEIIGPDVYRCESQVAIKAEDGTITDRRIVTRREWFTAVLGARPRARILLDADAVHRTGERVGAARRGAGADEWNKLRWTTPITP